MSIKIENTEVLGWGSAIRGMRNPMNSWGMSDSGLTVMNPNDVEFGYEPNYEYIIGNNDLKLMASLAKAGTDHRKFMRMLTVYVDFTAPLYWWKEFDTYKVGTVANSCSTMHKIHAKKFTIDDFSCEHLLCLGKNADFEDLPIYANERWDAVLLLQMVIKSLNHYRDRFIETKDKKYWWQMIQLLPTSYNQKRTIMLNYEVLANIYKSRKNHKLDEWRTFCTWIEKLPYSKLITDKGGSDE